MTSNPGFKCRVGTTQPQARRELPFRLKASALALALCLAGCGDTASTAEPATTSPSPSVTAATGSPTSATTASPTTATPASPSSEPGNGQWKATGASFGVDRAQWPGTIEGARTLLNALPKKLAGQARTLHTDPRDKNNAGAEYGTLASVSVGQEYVTRDTASGKPELLSANNLLAAHFNLGAACTKNSYRGTLPKDPDYPGPGVTEKPLKKSVWFSCRMLYDIGETEHTGHAVGWTSKRTAWLVIARDDKTARSLVTALHQSPEK